MKVNPKDGRCRSCSGALDIIDVDDATMTVACAICGDYYLVESDAFGDGGVHYWPNMMADLMGGIHEDD